MAIGECKAPNNSWYFESFQYKSQAYTEGSCFMQLLVALAKKKKRLEKILADKNRINEINSPKNT